MAICELCGSCKFYWGNIIIVDNKINFKNHINYNTGKVAKRQGILYRKKKLLATKTRFTYYNSYVLLYLNYNILHWGSTNDTHLKPPNYHTKTKCENNCWC